MLSQSIYVQIVPVIRWGQVQRFDIVGMTKRPPTKPKGQVVRVQIELPESALLMRCRPVTS